MKRHQILLLHIATSILVLFPFPIHAHKMMYQDSIEIVVHRGANHIAAGKHHSISSSCIETWSRLDRSGRAQK